MTERLPLSRILVEGVVIVTSILLAFGIDAAWDARQEGIRRSATMTGLKADFTATRVELDRVVAFRNSSISAAIELLDLTADGPIPSSAEHTADSLFTEAMIGGSFDAPLGTLESLINSGELALLGDPELTSVLVQFPALVADLDREQDWMRQLFLEFYRYLERQGSGVETIYAHPYFEDSVTLRADGISDFAHQAAFRGWLMHVWNAYRNTSRAFDRIDTALTGIETRLDRIE
jgi:hypothetical protein